LEEKLYGWELGQNAASAKSIIISFGVCGGGGGGGPVFFVVVEWLRLIWKDSCLSLVAGSGEGLGATGAAEERRLLEGVSDVVKGKLNRRVWCNDAGNPS
jgi:hypothetical protein